MAGRRKILFVTTDQQRHDTLGCYGGELSRTPVLDAVNAGTPVRFRVQSNPSPRVTDFSSPPTVNASGPWFERVAGLVASALPGRIRPRIDVAGRRGLGDARRRVRRASGRGERHGDQSVGSRTGSALGCDRDHGDVAGR